MGRTPGFGFGLLLSAAAACGPGITRTPTEVETCSSLSGSYLSSYGNTCGRFSNGDAATVTQDGCILAVTISGVGDLKGTITGETIEWTVEFPGDCKGTGTGVGRIDGRQISGTYSGFQSGASCCATTIAGTFSLSAK